MALAGTANALGAFAGVTVIQNGSDPLNLHTTLTVETFLILKGFSFTFFNYRR